jgi:isopenicillin N synthase-like dioxygenase
MRGPNFWPDLPGFREEVGAYYRRVFALGRTLLRGFALALGLEETALDRFVLKPPSQLRLVHYPPSPGATGIAAHTDYECFTTSRLSAP